MNLPQSYKVLIVDDDKRLGDLLRRYLSENRFYVTVVTDSVVMNQRLARHRYDLLILDLMLPGENGLSICRRLREGGDKTPIIMLTAKGEETDRVTGLDIGADDYLSKPFSPRELVARIKALLRRLSTKEHPGAPVTHVLDTFEFGEFSLDLSTRILKKKGEPIPLTTGEFSVLKAFSRHPKQPLSRDKLMEMVKGRGYEIFDRSLDVQISRVRKIIEPDPTHPRYIQTVWGLGYVFIPDK